MIIIGLLLRLPDTLNVLNLSSDLFNQNARVTIAGTITLFADVLLIIFVYEAIWRWFTKRHFFCIYLTMALILVFDTLLFTTGAFLGQSNYITILTSGVIGKLLMALPFSLAMTLYLYYGEPAKREPNSFEDIFDTLSYRQKFEIARHQGEKAEKELQVIEDRFQQLFEHSPVALFEEDFSELLTYLEKIKKKGVSDFRDYFNNNPMELQTCAQKVRINNLNQETLRLHKATSKEELLGNLDKIFTEKSFDIFKEEVIALTEGKLNFEAAGQVKTLDGDVREIFLKLQLQKDSQIALLATTDITERKRAERELRESNKRLMTVLDSIDAFIYIADMQTYEILFMNKYGLEAWGDIEGQLCWKAIQKDQEGPCAFCTNDKLLTQEGTPTGVYQWELHNSINDRWYDCRDTVIPWTDGRLVRMEIATDITARKNLETQLQQSQKMEAIGTLAGGIAHDFNNILSAIIGYAEFVKEEAPEESSIGEDIAEVLGAAKRATDLVKQILTFSRQLDHDKQVIHLYPIVKETLKMLGATLPATVEIKEDLDSDDVAVLANPTNIHQVIVNLCTNALHALPNQKGSLSVGLQQLELSTLETSGREKLSPGSFVVLSVSDSGCGMDQPTIDRLFDPYFTTKELGKGTGLGLAVVNGIVEDCKGFIEVESVVGKGTTFSVYFPVAEESVAQHVASEQKHGTTATSGGERVLIVDDELLLVKINQKRLESRGYQVTGFSDSRVALEKFRDHPEKFDLLITDQTMPGLSGAELSKAVLEIKPSLPIIMCTGHSDIVSKENALFMGIKKYVFKPIQGDELLDAVQAVFVEE